MAQILIMIKIKDISKADCIKLATKIQEDIYKPAFNFKTTIFLCGADISQTNMMRYKFSEALKNNSLYWFYFDIICPEDIFDELLYSSKSGDLISLEGLLADSVDVIILIPESPGSFAELGVFANNAELRKKLICIIDKGHRKDKSFINQGPLKLVKKENKKGILYVDPNNIENEISKLTSAIKKIKKKSTKKSDKISLLQLDNFILPSIFLLQPVTKSTLIKMVKHATRDVVNSYQTTTTALTSLTKKKLCELTSKGYKLTLTGIEKFLYFQKTKSRVKRHDEIIKMDDLRLEIFNLRYRGKTLRV